MERITVMKTINCSLSQQQPMFDVMKPSLPHTSFAQKPNRQLRDIDASFSAYLKPDESNNQHVGGRTVDDCEISIFDAQKYFNETNDQKEGNIISHTVSVDGISEACDLSALPRFSSVSSVDGYSRNYRARSFHATPTASSEASWNSQTGLLSNPPGSVKVSLRNLNPTDAKKRERGSSSRWFFGRRCPCSGKKSVQVEEKLSEPKTPVRLNHNSNIGSLNNPNNKKQTPKSVENMVVEKAPNKPEKSLVTRDWAEIRREVTPNSQRFSEENRSPSKLGHRVLASSGRSFSDATHGFSFPILNQSSPVKLVLNILPPATTPSSEDPPRDSLEVFQPSEESSISRKSADLQQRERRSFTFPASPKSRDDDVASDASSDLFEIESFSTQTASYPMYHRRDSLDANGTLYCRSSLDEPMAPSIAPTECYEPSEVSIDWSVTTAEGFDRASVTNLSITASEADEIAFMRRELENRGGGYGGGGDVGGSKRRGNGLLSCRCEKAVNVGPHPVRCVPEGHRVGLPVPLSSTLRHVSGRPPSFSKPPLATSHSARLSIPYAT